ncbi:hypothetical protein MDA_GLEAN10010005 [Myotis davidii]|uniref:Uncharacterized protein n=1 Tax=Myotis davidii TaxID=225400 RepID=L5LPQ2_MYODS|nr:hypothetical protein MDA_GLEAN10010005 [Myotis davidii]
MPIGIVKNNGNPSTNNQGRPTSCCATPYSRRTTEIVLPLPCTVDQDKALTSTMTESNNYRNHDQKDLALHHPAPTPLFLQLQLAPYSFC